MKGRLLHIFRNTPLGRETLLQSIYFCKTIGLTLSVYIPGHSRFFLQLGNRDMPIDLDRSYFAASETASDHARTVAEKEGIRPDWIAPTQSEEGKFPTLRNDFAFMCCPRIMSGVSSQIGLGHIGSRVRRIVGFAPFPVLIASAAHKPWRSIVVFFGGSDNAVNALKLGIALKRVTGLPLTVFTQSENGHDASSPESLEAKGCAAEITPNIDTWNRYDSGNFVENLYDVPHDALALLGSGGRGLVKNFSSKMEKIQSTLPNNMLLVGPNYAQMNGAPASPKSVAL